MGSQRVRHNLANNTFSLSLTFKRLNVLKNHRNVLPKKTFLKTYTSELGKVFKDI